MGLGGNLIWTSVFRAHADRFGAENIAVACDTPMLTDVLCGRWWRLDRDYRNDVILRNISIISHVDSEEKKFFSRYIDMLFEKLISADFLRRSWESFVFARSEKAWRQRKSKRLMHIDMRIHSYALTQTATRTIWKKGGNAAHVIAQGFGLEVPHPKSIMEFESSEEISVEEILKTYGVTAPFIVIEPDTNRDWFGDLRAWSNDRWQKIVDIIRDQHPEITIVQTGVGGNVQLRNVVNMVDKTDFRQAALMIGKAKLFIGTEGGLMHAASAVKAQALILWGGVTLPEFAGYPTLHTIICHYVDCAPCGNLGWCDNGRKCMDQIEVDEVKLAVSKLVEKDDKGGS